MRVNSTFKGLSDDTKKDILFFNLPIVKPNNKNISLGCQLTLKSSTTTGDLIIEMSKQIGTTKKGELVLPTFDHKNKCSFTLSPFESAKIVKGIENFKPGKLEFAHKNAKNPKFINIIFSVYKENPQMQVEVNAKNGETPIRYSIYLDESEIEVFKEFLKSSYSPIYKKLYIEGLYDSEFEDRFSAYEERFKAMETKLNGFLEYVKTSSKADKEFKQKVLELLSK
ncbi:hypothetical protein [Cetobacterium sp.]|uniref:hypothetical protein n=1 Tax=Cetobacterium sp. TaxID=2071632 RepID=UPI003F367081